MATQPGIHVREPGTERYLSIWDSRDALMAMRDRVPPPDAMAIYDVEQSGGPAV